MEKSTECTALALSKDVGFIKNSFLFFTEKPLDFLYIFIFKNRQLIVVSNKMYGLLFNRTVPIRARPIEDDVKPHVLDVKSLRKRISVWIRAGSPKSQTNTNEKGPRYYKYDRPLRFSTATYDAVVPCNKEEGADLAV